MDSNGDFVKYTVKELISVIDGKIDKLASEQERQFERLETRVTELEHNNFVTAGVKKAVWAALAVVVAAQILFPLFLRILG